MLCNGMVHTLLRVVVDHGCVRYLLVCMMTVMVSILMFAVHHSIYNINNVVGILCYGDMSLVLILLSQLSLGSSLSETFYDLQRSLTNNNVTSSPASYKFIVMMRSLTTLVRTQ